MIKLVVSDLDGTLLDGNSRLADLVADGIRKLEEAGIEFMVATGRKNQISAPIFNEVGLYPAFINVNGGLVFDREGNNIQTNPIEKVKARKIVELGFRMNCTFQMVTSQGVYALNADEIRRSWLNTFDKTGSNLVMYKNFLETLQELESVDEVDGLEVVKFLFSVPTIELREKIIEGLEEIKDLEITSSAMTNVEVTGKGVSKGLALLAYIDGKYDKDEVVVIGDSPNDLSMFERFKYSYAVGNAVPEIKDLAYKVVGPNHEHGILEVFSDALDRKIN